MKKYDEKYDVCPACNSVDIKYYHKDFRGNTIYRCDSCDVQFMNPVYSDAYLDDFYSSYVPVNSEKDIELTDKQAYVIKNNFKAIQKHIPSIGRMLDFGIANGTHARVARDKGWDVIGYDVDCATTSKIEKKIGIDIKCGNFFNIDWDGASFDLIYANQVLEHIKNPVDYLQHFHGILNRNGFLFITVPNIDSTSNRIKYFIEKIGLRKARVGKYYDTDHHVFYYSPKSLANILKQNGYKVIFSKNCEKPKIERSAIWLFISNKIIERFYSTSTFMLIAKKS